MSKKKREEERAWKARKENQQPHGKVKGEKGIGTTFLLTFPLIQKT
jgi:hypothetical protein